MTIDQTVLPRGQDDPLSSMPTSSSSNATRNAPRITPRKFSTNDVSRPHATPVKRGEKRKAGHSDGPPPNTEVIDLTADVPQSVAKKAKSSPRMPPIHPFQSVVRGDFVTTHRVPSLKGWSESGSRDMVYRMFVVGHTVGGTEDAPEISFDIVGTTGNLYKTVIRKEPICNCPDALKGNQCKHICYALVHVLKAPSHLQYQLAFLASELREIYQGSFLSQPQSKPGSVEDNNGNRKPIEGDCPICFMEFEPNEEVVWCKAACGNNIHKACFDQWAAKSHANGVRCVYCRTPWEFGSFTPSLESLERTGNVNDDGYINVAAQYGLSDRRDYSVYSRWSTARPSFYYGQPRRVRYYYGHY